MLLGGITIPEALITAHEEGRLVIFTGAGISIAPPSNLPSFLALCEQVAVKLQSSEDPNASEWKPQLIVNRSSSTVAASSGRPNP